MTRQKKIAEKDAGTKGDFIMKKFLAMMMAMMMAFSVAACGGGEEAAPAEPTMVELSNGYVTMMVPEAYSDVQQMEGMVGAGGPGGSVIISDPIEADIAAADVTEEVMLMLAGDSYPDVEMLAFENPSEVDGTEAVYASMKGTNATSGLEHTMEYFMVFYMLDDVLNMQNICVMYQAGEGADMETYLDDVVSSIKVG